LIVIGCDFGLRKSGIVVLDENNNILEQVLIRVNSIGAQRLFEIEQSFDKLLSRLPSDEKIQIFIEGYAYGAKYQRESLAELGGVMRRYFYVNNLNFWVIPPTSVKTFVTGIGRASKNYMKKRTKEKWGHTFRSDDVCDAHGLARLGVAAIKSADLGVPVGTEESELAVLKDMLIHRDHYENGNTAKRSKKPTRRTRQKVTNDTSKTTTKG
jgi:Holliday junction resolvasome RuvABC endonuclease subunit